MRPSFFILFTLIIISTIILCTEFFTDANASSQNEEICIQNGGNLKNFGNAMGEYLDYCMDLNPNSCDEINGTWRNCVGSNCPDISRPCTSVQCIAYDVCVLYDEDAFQQEIEQQITTIQFTNVIIAGAIITSIMLIYIIWKTGKKKTPQT